MSVSEKEVRHVAKLARLALSDSRAATERLHPLVAMLARTHDAQRAMQSYLSRAPVAFEGN